MGLYPNPLLSRMEKSIEATLARVKVVQQVHHAQASGSEETVHTAEFSLLRGEKLSEGRSDAQTPARALASELTTER
jgi:hypothetical protein